MFIVRRSLPPYPSSTTFRASGSIGSFFALYSSFFLYLIYGRRKRRPLFGGPLPRPLFSSASARTAPGGGPPIACWRAAGSTCRGRPATRAPVPSWPGPPRDRSRPGRRARRRPRAAVRPAVCRREDHRVGPAGLVRPDAHAAGELIAEGQDVVEEREPFAQLA